MLDIGNSTKGKLERQKAWRPRIYRRSRYQFLPGKSHWQGAWRATVWHTAEQLTLSFPPCFFQQDQKLRHNQARHREEAFHFDKWNGTENLKEKGNKKENCTCKMGDQSFFYPIWRLWAWLKEVIFSSEMVIVVCQENYQNNKQMYNTSQCRFAQHGDASNIFTGYEKEVVKEKNWLSNLQYQLDISWRKMLTGRRWWRNQRTRGQGIGFSLRMVTITPEMSKDTHRQGVTSEVWDGGSQWKCRQELPLVTSITHETT